MIIEQLQSTKFDANEHELAEITKKIIHKIENKDTDDYFSEKDYEKLLRYYLNKNNESGLKIILSSTIISLLKTETGKIKIFEFDRAKQLEDIQFNLLVQSIKKGNLSAVNFLCSFSPNCKAKLNKQLTLFELKEMIPGATLFHLALKHGNVEIAKALIAFGADPNIKDYYDNSSLHFACMGGNETYMYVKQLGCTSSENIFCHIPEDYLNKKDRLLLVNQQKLINSFINYIRLNKFDESIITKTKEGNDKKGSDLIEEIDHGICSGESFIKAINIVRGKDSAALYEKMSAAIREWVGTKEALDKTLEDKDLINEFSNLRDVNLRGLFEYMMSIILASQQYSSIPILDIKKDDRIAMFELLKNKDDKLILLEKVNSKITTREAFKEKLENLLLEPNTLVEIYLEDKKLHEFGHGIFLVTDESSSLFFIDPNTPYKIAALKNDATSIDKITNIIFAYFNNVQQMAVYHYENELNLKNKLK